MKNIVINGCPLTPEAGEAYLSVLKQEYEFHKDRAGSFRFGGQEVLCSYAKYLIEYLKDCLNEKTTNSKEKKT
jgi:hypothetical protein